MSNREDKKILTRNIKNDMTSINGPQDKKNTEQNDTCQ